MKNQDFNTPLPEGTSSNVTFEVNKNKTIFSFHTALNLYNAYSLGGLAHTGALAATSLADHVLSSNNITDKNYSSLSSFWGYVGWNAIKQIQSSEKIPTQYKVPLYAASSLISVGMICLGPDIFASKTNHKKTLDSTKLIASFFDKTGEIAKLEDEFSKGYVSGITHAISNFKQILSNKFILFSLLYQGIDIAKLVLVQKFFQYMPAGKMASFFAAKEDNPINYLIKLSLLKLVKEVIETVHSKIVNKLKVTLKKDIDKHVIEIVLQNDSTQKVMDLGPKVNTLSQQISTIYEEATTQTSQTLQGLVRPLVIPSNHSSQASIPLLGSNPSLFLLDSLINTIFNYTNINIVEKWITTKLYGQKKEEDSEDTEIVSQKIGQCTLNSVSTPSSYTYGNIQEIAKLGGNKYMLSKVLAYIEKNSTSHIQSNSTIRSLLDFIKNSIQEFLYAGVFISQGITQEELFSIEMLIGNLTTTLGLNNNLDLTIYGASQEVDPAEILSTLKILKEQHHGGPERLLSETMILSLENYHLKKHAENTDMLHIENLEFKPGNIYAITGKIGTGKTTLLTDVAKCLMPIFCSSGKIFYPTYQHHAIKEIFCGTTPFSPPATTLFERLTYRLDQEYVNSHKEELMKKAIQLFTTFEQQGFSEEKLSTKGNDTNLSLSEGQKKLVILMSAIIYKQHLDKPVLFVIDETLANLDEDTEPLVCREIKKIFSDSIVLSVDHKARHNMDFYSKLINLASYKPGAIKETEVAITGDAPDSPGDYLD